MDALLRAVADIFIKLIAVCIIAVHSIAGILAPALGVVPTPLATSTLQTQGVVGTTATGSFPTASTTKPASKPAAKAITTAASVPASTKLTPSTPAPAQTQPQVDINAQTRAALVNILCTTSAGGSFAPISGSGIIVDSRGIILTNAHVGQFFLLRDYGHQNNIQCVVRTGSPASPAYTADLMYLPPQWVADNATQLVAQQATGVGQNDFAFLRITGTTNPSGTLPSEFPHVTLAQSAPSLGDKMLIAAYPAGFLSGELIQTSLYASSAFSYVVQLFTFDNPHEVDLFSIAGSIESQPGASGGAVVRADSGALEGIVVTATTASNTNERDLRAITLVHIDLALRSFGLSGLVPLLSRDPTEVEAYFNANLMPNERQKLYDVLNSVH